MKATILLGDVAAIEGVARGFEPGLAPAAGGGALLVGHVLQRAGEIGLAEDVAGLAAPGRRAERSPPMDGQARWSASCRFRLAAISGYIGKPSRASRIAAAATSPKLIVP